MIYISDSLYIPGAEILDPILQGPDNPRIGWHNLITFGNVQADSETTDGPVTNISNPATDQIWQSASTAVQYINITLSESESVDYIGIAGHNFGTESIPYVLQSSVDGNTWVDVFDEQQPANDRAIIHHFDPDENIYWRLAMTPDGVAPRIAVIYLGRILVMTQRIYVGHTPINYGRQTTYSGAKSESGQYLGRIIRGTTLRTSVEFTHIRPAFYRASVDPFVEAARENPFFWSWYPSSYPNEVGYCWTTGDIKPANQMANGMMQFEFNVEGIAP